MMERLHRFILHSLTSKVFLVLLASVYVVYLATGAHFLSTSLSTPTSLLAPLAPISEQAVETNSSTVVAHWTVANMRSAIDADLLFDPTALTQRSNDQTLVKGDQQKGQPSPNENLVYPLSTVGKVFFTNASGRDSMCSGTAVVSSNHSVVDTAGHCLYMYGGWSKNVLFCPLYHNGETPYGCWAARDLEVPSDWINAKPNDYHHDFGIAIVAANSQGTLTDLVGGVGWAYNQPANQPFYAYGYPAAPPFDGHTRQSCGPASGTLSPHGGGNVVSISCNMTGGSSGGPWFIQSSGNWYLNGHNDFINGLQPNRMFSPYYDDTWYALYQKAQNT